jgi:hypothetical protein
LIAVDRRHSSMIAGLNDRLGDWYRLESKLLEESARRIEQFERGVGHEWVALRQLHEEPLTQMKGDAEQLRIACLDAARTARSRLDSLEKAHTSYTAELERRLTEWSRELLGAVAAASGGRGDAPALPGSSTVVPAASPAAPHPWPLDGVAELQQEIHTGGATDPETAPLPPGQARTHPALTTRSAALFAVAVIAVVALGGYAMLRSVPSPPPPDAAGATSPRANDERVVEAQRAADRAATLADILAAADLRRFALVGVVPSTPDQPSGQVLWSPSRGLAASASRLAPPPDGKVYRLWIIPDGSPVAAGILAPDAAGRATLLIAGPLALPTPQAIRVTLEDMNETTTPRGPVCLAHVPGT